MDFNREEAEKQRRMMEGSPPTPRYVAISGAEIAALRRGLYFES
jgi:hypothetical protein